MLDRRDISKLNKPFTIALASKTTMFLTLVIFLAAQGLTGFQGQNSIISHCDPYINHKISNFQNQMLALQFLVTVFGLLISSISLGKFINLIIHFRNEHKQNLSKKKRLSQNRIKTHFFFTFIESICIINILSRSIEQVAERNVCDLENQGTFIAILILSIFAFFISAFTVGILFRFLSMIEEKQKSLEEFSFYSDQITLQENLLFNKTGYIKELLKLEDYTSRSTNMKDELIKSFPSGYKKNEDLSPKRQVLYRLRGGNTTSNTSARNNLAPQKIPQDEGSSQLKNSQVKIAQEQNSPLKLNLMAVDDKTLDETPNNESYLHVELTNNVIDLSVDRGILEDLNEESEYQSEEDVENQHYPGPSYAKRKEGLSKPKQQKDIELEMKLEEELRQKFNLTSNTDVRRRYANKRNQQNIDDYGNYLYVDVQKIKKRSKLLDFQKINKNNEEAAQVDPNKLYAKIQFVPHQKRLGKKHQKYVSDYLKKLNKLKKEEVLYEQPVQYSENFDQDSQESSEEQEQSSSDSVNPTQVIDPVTGQPMTEMSKRKKKQKNQGPELYLYIKKKKKTGRQNKLKLYEDEDGFYDSEEQKQNEQGDENGLKDLQKGLQSHMKPHVNGQKFVISGVSKEQQHEKSKHEEKIVLTNKHLETHEARMLRFIHRKYIRKEPEHDYHQSDFGQHQNTKNYQNLNPFQNMSQPFNMTQSPIQIQGQSFNPQQFQNLVSQQHPPQSFEGNIFSPPTDDQMNSYSNQQVTPLPYQMSPNPQNSPGFPSPFYMQTPQPLNQPSTGYNTPQNYRPPTNK